MNTCQRLAVTLMVIALTGAVVPPARATDRIPIGMFEFHKKPPGGTRAERAVWYREAYRELRGFGVDRLYYHMRQESFHTDNPDDIDPADLHALAHAEGIELIPIVTITGQVGKRLKTQNVPLEEFLQILQPSGDVAPTWRFVCVRNPRVRAETADILRGLAAEAKEIPGLRALALEDEFSIRSDWTRGGGIACYCPVCTAWWKERTGEDPPAPVPVPPGTVVDDADPLFRWLRETRGDVGNHSSTSPLLADYNRFCRESVQEIAPDIAVVQMPGGVFGELDYHVQEFYFYSWLIPELYAVGHIETAYRTHEQPNDIWPLIGWFQRVPFPDWVPHHLHLMAKLLLARQAKSVDFASVPFPWNYRRQVEMKRYEPAAIDFGPMDWWVGRDDIRQAHRRLVADIDRYADLLLKLKPKPMPVAVLHSETTIMLQSIADWEANAERMKKYGWVAETPWEHSQAQSIAYPALLQAHLPVEMITEHQVAAGRLADYRALVLVNCQYLPRSVYDRIEQYAENGGIVLADRSSLVRPPGAVKLNIGFDAWSRLSEAGLRTSPDGIMALITKRDEADLESVEYSRRLRDTLIAQLAYRLREQAAPQLPQPVKIDNHRVVYLWNTDGRDDYLFFFNSDLDQAQTCAVDITELEPASVTNLTAGNRTLAGAAFSLTVPPGDWQILKVTREHPDE